MPWNSIQMLVIAQCGPATPLRRTILRGHHLDRHLLPAHMPGQTAQAREYALLLQCGRRRGRRFQALSALPAGTGPGSCARGCSVRLVGAAIAGIEEHALSSAQVGELAASLGISDRHLRRVTEAELGVSPIELAQTQRLLLAKRLLRETSLSQTEIAFASGFGSVRRFNALFKSRYGLSPRAIRGKASGAEVLSVQLEFRPPLAWEQFAGLFAFARHSRRGNGRCHALSAHRCHR